MASTDATSQPKKNTAFRVTFVIFNNTGQLVTGAAGLDSEISKDGGALADCTNEATEIGGGFYYLDLTSTEMNADTVAVIVKTTTTDARTTPLVFYPQEAGDVQVNATYIAGAAVSTSTAQIGTNVVSMATDSVTSTALATSAVTEIQSGLATSSALATVQADTDDIQTRIPAALVAGRIDASVGAMGADVITATALATSAVTEIQSGLATSSALATVQADTDDIQTRIPTALVAGRIDANVGAMGADVVTASAIAADAVTEIQSGLATSAAQTTAEADLDDIQTRIPAALVAGRIDASVGAMAADVITATALATSAANEIADSVWGFDPSGALPASIAEFIADIPTATENATALLTYIDGVETGITPQGALRVMLAAMAGKLSGAATTTITIRNVGDSVNRIVATVDTDGNRSAVTTNVS